MQTPGYDGSQLERTAVGGIIRVGAEVGTGVEVGVGAAVGGTGVSVGSGANVAGVAGPDVVGPGVAADAQATNRMVSRNGIIAFMRTSPFQPDD